MRKIKNINYSITNVCNRKCKDCSLNIPYRMSLKNERPYMSIKNIKDSAKYLQGYSINITGGEPTIHPKFTEIVPKLRGIFKPSILSIETNGYGFSKFPEIFKYFDVVHFTHYIKGTYFSETEDNTKDLEFMQKNYPEVNIVEHGLKFHISRDTPILGNMCDKGTSATVSYINGLMYPCCVAYGMNNAIGIKLSDTWSKDILDVIMPCKNCFFSI
jgi:MoaA/NifB/PqqE/SkfB family radical SAM enzyme